MHVVHTLSFSTSWRSLNMPWGTRDGWRPLLYSVCGSRRHNNTQLVPHSLYYRQYLLLYSLSTDSEVSLGETVMAVQREERLVDRLADLTSAGVYIVHSLGERSPTTGYFSFIFSCRTDGEFRRSASKKPSTDLSLSHPTHYIN